MPRSVVALALLALTIPTAALAQTPDAASAPELKALTPRGPGLLAPTFKPRAVDPSAVAPKISRAHADKLAPSPPCHTTTVFWAT